MPEFSDSEQMFVMEGLRALLAVKMAAFEVVHKDPRYGPMTEADFGIPQIQELVTRLEIEFYGETEEESGEESTGKFEVIVSNIGTVYMSESLAQAEDAFNTYVEKSRHYMGRAAGEIVTLMENGEIRCEADGSLYQKGRK